MLQILQFLRRMKDLRSIHFKLNAASNDQTAETRQPNRRSAHGRPNRKEQRNHAWNEDLQ